MTLIDVKGYWHFWQISKEKGGIYKLELIKLEHERGNPADAGYKPRKETVVNTIVMSTMQLQILDELNLYSIMHHKDIDRGPIRSREGF